MTIGPQIQGIYIIVSKSTGRIYVGCSDDVRRRWKDHIYKLSKGVHHNPYLQGHFTKYGFDDLEFALLHDCSQLTYSELLVKEAVVVRRLGSFGNRNFNLTAGGDQHNFDHRRKTCSLMNIQTGEVKEFQSLTEAALFIGVDRSSVSKILNGKKPQMKGWCCAALGYKKSEQERRSRSLFHPEHGYYRIGDNIREFCDKFSLNYRSVKNFLYLPERNKSYKGWIRVNTMASDPSPQ